MYCKVCGITENAHLEKVAGLPIELIGLNFYPLSPRYVIDRSIKKINNIKYVGVFVNSTLDDISEKINHYKLDYVQLHGDEDEKYCKKVSEIIPVIKVFRVNESFNFEETKAFESCKYFLFDTKTARYGGSGKKFDWHSLSKYDGNVEFFLSGGISPEDAQSIKEINHPMMIGVDINSRFETKPGFKNLDLVLTFLKEIKNL